MLTLCYSSALLLFCMFAHAQQIVVSAGVTWILPSPGHTFHVGQPIKLTWAANQTASAPESFRLCVAHAGGSVPLHMDLEPIPDHRDSPHIDIGSISRTMQEPVRREAVPSQVICGIQVWSDVHNANGTFSVAFSAPNVTSSSLCYVQMFTNSQGTLISPLFRIQEYNALYIHGKLSKIAALTIGVPVGFALLIALAACFSAIRQRLRVRTASKAAKTANSSRIVLDDPFLAKHSAAHLPPVDRDPRKLSLALPIWCPKVFDRSVSRDNAVDLEKALAHAVSAEVAMQLEKRDSYTTVPKREVRHNFRWAPSHTAASPNDNHSTYSQSTTSTFAPAEICQAEPAHIQQPRLAPAPTYLPGPLSLSPEEVEDEINDSIIASYMTPSPYPDKYFSAPLPAPVRRECLPRSLTSGAMIPLDPVQLRVPTSGRFMAPSRRLSPTSDEEKELYSRVQRAVLLPSPYSPV